MKKRIYIQHILTLVLLIMIMISGCTVAQKPVPKVDVEEKPFDINQVNKDVIKGEAVADTLVDQTGIDDATVLFLEKKAIVGVDVSEGKEGVITEEMRTKIENIVRDFDAEVREIAITADKKTFYKLDDIQQSMIRGEQSKTANKDIEEILNKITNKK